MIHPKKMRLFKYVRAERVDILENQQIAFTPPGDFNDAFDSKPKVIPITKKVVLKRKAKAEETEALKHLPLSFHTLPRANRRKIAREFLKHSINQLHKDAESFTSTLQEGLCSEINQTFGVLCLTTTPDNKLMWGHYADGHRGFVIEFDTENQRFALSEEMHRIIYSDEPPIYDPAIGSQGWWKIKGKEWQYEAEHRIVSQLSACEKRICGGKTIYLHPLPRSCIKAVFMGLKMDDVVEETTSRGLPKIRNQYV